MSEDGLHMEKLTGEENWATWSILVKTILECDGLWSVVEGTYVKPQEGSVEYNQKLREWSRINANAKKRIMLSLNTGPLLRVGGCETAKDVWNKLNQVYNPESTENIDIYRHKFHNIKWENCGIQAHLSKFDNIQTKMTMLGKPIEEGDMCARLLQTLPKDYDHIYVTWHDQPEEERTWSKLQRRCLNYELRMTGREDEEEKGACAMMSKLNLSKSYKNEKDKRKSTYKENVKCFSCGKIGHISKYCRIGLICYRCKGKGHKSNNCPKNKSNFAMVTKAETEAIDMNNLSTCDLWFVDSGATHHVTNRREWYDTFIPFNPPKKMDSARQGVQIEALGFGRINVKCFDGNQWNTGHFEDVWFCPDSSCNLFSVKRAGDKGINQYIKNNGKDWIFTKDDRVIAVASSSGEADLYRLAVKVICTERALIAAEKDTLQSWHEKLGHQNKKYVHAFLKDRGIDVKLDSEFCEGCVLGKHHRMTFGERVDKSTSPGDLIFADVCGPMEVNDLNGYRYYLVFKDDFSSFRTTYLLRRKEEVKDKLPLFIEMVKAQAQIPVKELRTDGGTEFNNVTIHNYTEQRGLKHSVTAPYSPQQCGVAERENRILCEMARSWLQSAQHLPKALWGEAVLAATHTLNRTAPTKEKGKVPIELFLKKKSHFDHLRIFGTECYAWVADQKRRKFDAKSKKGYFVGYSDCGYRIYFPDSHKVSVCRDVKFKPEILKVSMKPCTEDAGEETTEHEDFKEEKSPNRRKDSQEEGTRKECAEDNLKEEKTSENDKYFLRDREKMRKPIRFADENAKILLMKEAPTNYDEAIKGDDSMHWKAAMDEEFKSLIKNNTWDLVEKPQECRVIDDRWVYAIKNSNGDETRYKARLVARGFSQRPGIDYVDTFSPVARFETMRALLGFAIQHDWQIKQFDMKTAFLNGTLEEEVYMKQPQGYEDNTTRVCKLLRSIYGLKQSSKCWYTCLTDYLEAAGLRESSADPCMFYGDNILMFFHVDDGLIMGPLRCIEDFLQKLASRFELTVYDVNNYLGIQIKHYPGCIELNQSSYAEKLLTKYDMADCKPLSLPIEPGWTPGKSALIKNDIYREMVGSLIYLANGTRPDLTYAVNVASRAQDKPTNAHLNLVRRIFRYIKGTIHEGITFKKSNVNLIEAYSDADHAGDKITRKSTSGTLIKFSGGPVLWKSKLQKCVALSSMEAEYVAASDAAKSLVWFDRLLKEIKAVEENTTPLLLVDNQSALALMKNPVFHERSKHIETRYHFVRNLVNEKRIFVEYIPTEFQAADVLTKALPSAALNIMKGLIGMTTIT